eukprot:746356-Rhodomonas_salina.1
MDVTYMRRDLGPMDVTGAPGQSLHAGCSTGVRCYQQSGVPAKYANEKGIPVVLDVEKERPFIRYGRSPAVSLMRFRVTSHHVRFLPVCPRLVTRIANLRISPLAFEDGEVTYGARRDLIPLAEVIITNDAFPSIFLPGVPYSPSSLPSVPFVPEVQSQVFLIAHVHTEVYLLCLTCTPTCTLCPKVASCPKFTPRRGKVEGYEGSARARRPSRCTQTQKCHVTETVAVTFETAQVISTEGSKGSVLLRRKGEVSSMCYAMSGTDVAYAAMRCP